MKASTWRVFVGVVAGLSIGALGCGGETGGGGSGGDDGEATESGTTDGDTGEDEGADTDGADDGTTTGEIPDCQFTEPQGASCNPYPECPGTGCPVGQICTVTMANEINRVECADPGDVPLGGTCDYEAGQRCAEGVCHENQCRAFCVGIEHCPNNASCGTMSGVPGKPTVCGKAQADCDPLDAENSCGPGLACYLHPSGLTDCLPTQGGGNQGDACECVNCCSPGFTCYKVGENQACSQNVAVTDGNSCGQCPAERECKILTETVGACAPVQGGGDGGGTDGGPDPIPCNVLEQDCEGAAQGCYPTNQGDQCLVKGNKANGADCNNVNDCQIGSTCFASKCRPICDPANGLHPECETGAEAQCPPLSNSAGGYCDE